MYGGNDTRRHYDQIGMALVMGAVEVHAHRQQAKSMAFGEAVAVSLPDAGCLDEQSVAGPVCGSPATASKANIWHS
jgi:hypothetical protein